MEMLYNQQAAIVFDSQEKGRLLTEIESPHVILTVPHKPWQGPNLQVLAALNKVKRYLIEDRLCCRMIERCFEPYRNPWFLVPKKGYEKDEDGRMFLDSVGKAIR